MRKHNILHDISDKPNLAGRTSAADEIDLYERHQNEANEVCRLPETHIKGTCLSSISQYSSG